MATTRAVVAAMAASCAVGAAAGALGLRAARAAPPPAPTPVQLLRTVLEGVPGQEVVITTTEWAPGQRLPWHVHPGGHEFGYVLEGEMTYEVEGHGTTVVKAGEVHQVLPGVPHFGRNAGPAKARTLVFRVKDVNQPISAPVAR
jgi:quercetin dioxygenase-like cupin family protein